MHFCPSPVYPGVLVQSKDPWVLLQNASELQSWASATHSSISGIRFILNNRILSRWKIKIYLTWAEKHPKCLANAILRSFVVPDFAFLWHLFVSDPQSIFGPPLLYSVTVWMCLLWYHSRDLKFIFFYFFYYFFLTIIANRRLRWYCVISKVGLLPTLLTLSLIKLWQDASPINQNLIYVFLYSLITCTVPSVSQEPRFTCAVVGSFGVVTNRIRTTIVSFSFTLIDVWNHIDQ